jgi:ABC-type branched-subunit amino acid transport system substrate-binding protein
VKAILLPQSWEEASLLVGIGNQAKIPVLSFADSTPLWATKRWPFLLQASPDQNAQMKAIAAIVDSWEWHQVTVIYEDNDSFRSGITPYLSDALREVGVEISNLVALSPFDSSSFYTKLKRLKGEQCRVFLVHLSLPLAVKLFVKAKEMNMTEKDYVWITTDPFTSLVHSLNASTISSMQGIIGVKSYYPQKDPHFQNFHTRFRKNFSLENPEEDNHEPGAFAMQAYDVVWTVCLAMRERSNGGQQLLDKILLGKFNGLGRKVKFDDRKVAPVQIFQIINVIGKSYNELGYWSNGLGFSETSTVERDVYKTSMSSLGQVIWPGRPRTTPRGWTPPTVANPLRIGVPTQSGFKQYVKVEHNSSTNSTNFTGFAIDLFRETVASLPFYLPYTFISFDGNYDEMVEQVYLKVRSSLLFLTNQVIIFGLQRTRIQTSYYVFIILPLALGGRVHS